MNQIPQWGPPPEQPAQDADEDRRQSRQQPHPQQQPYVPPQPQTYGDTSGYRGGGSYGASPYGSQEQAQVPQPQVPPQQSYYPSAYPQPQPQYQPQHLQPYQAPLPLPQPAPVPVAPPTPAPGYGPERRFGPPRQRPPRRRRRRGGLIVSTVVASLFLLAGGLGVVHEAGKETAGAQLGKAQEKGQSLWALKEGRDLPKGDSYKGIVEGLNEFLATTAWFEGNTIVHPEKDRVAAYDMDSGRTVWELKLPEGMKMCGAAQEQDGSVGVFAYGADNKCSTLSAVDMAARKQLWTAEKPTDEDMPDLGAYGEKAPSFAVSGGTVLTDWNGGQAYGLRDGAERWNAKGTAPKGCTSLDFVGGANLVAFGNCSSSSAGKYQSKGTVLGLDPGTGRPKWTWQTDQRVVAVPGTSPVVVGLSKPLDLKGGAGGMPTPNLDDILKGKGNPMAAADGQVVLLDDAGKALFTVSEGNPQLAESAPVADNDTLYVPGNKSGTGMSVALDPVNQIVGVDRATGKPKWTKALDGTKVAGGKAAVAGSVKPLSVDDQGNLIAYVTVGMNMNPKVVRYAKDNGDTTVLTEYPASIGLHGIGTNIYVHEGRTFLVGNAGSAANIPGLSGGSYQIIALK